MKKINKKGHKFIVFLLLISLLLLFVTCGDQGGGTSGPQGPSEPSKPIDPIPNNSYRVIYDKNAIDATGTMEYSDFTFYYFEDDMVIMVYDYLSINNFIRNNYCFLGWAKTPASTTVEYTDGQSIYNLTTAGKTITLYAVWHEAYTVEVTTGSTLADKFTWITNNAESYTTYIIDINSDNNLDSQTLSYGAKKYVTIHLKGNGSIKENYSSSLFTINSGVTLILDGNITILGNDDGYYYSSLISVSGGYLIMNGGKISGNTSSDGGGVYVNNGIFTMNGGEISGNTSYYPDGSGGVYVNSGTFTMNGGEISGNTSSWGGGVCVQNGTFTMNGGEISGNTSFYGGGVYATTFTMNGGKISGNSSSYRGGGVYSSTFTMKDGEISDNTAINGGGGVYFDSTFNKTGGTITGSNSSNGNVVKDSYGNTVNNKGRAVFIDRSSFEKRKETTSGPGDNLSFTYNNNNPTWSGAWDY